MLPRDRILDFRRVPASVLRTNPRNWRTHPIEQRQALAGILAEVGYADALLARELPDGALELIDGHLRAETTPEAIVPVLVLDLTEAEAEKLLATLDPLAAMAGRDPDLLGELLDRVQTEDEGLRRLYDSLRGDADDSLELDAEESLEIRESYQVVAECHDEAQQQLLYNRLTGEGFKCRLLSL